MSKKILIITTSLRRGSNSDALAEQFAKGAAQAGHSVETLSLRDKNLQFCRGCLACQSPGKCVIRDDVAPMLEQIRTADVLVFATPIYFYEMSGQMKVLLDRTDPLYPVEYSFRDIYLLATAAEGEECAVDGAVNGLNGWIACFEKARLAGVVRGVGADGPNTIQINPAMVQAYEMGKRA